VKVHTHRATLDDDRALAVLDAQAWPPELWVVTPQDADEPFFGPRREPQDVIVATLDGAVVGYARIGRHMAIAANDHVLHLEALAVSPAARGMGVGSLVIEVTIAEAFSRGARKLGLRALSTNAPAIRLYERAGFREEGRLKDEIRLPDGSFADDVWFALPLI
jgi:ribosomal protein S18 acetylase RimI-like enzyme